MDSTYTYPKLRWPLDIRIEKIGDANALFINCPHGISERPLLLVPEIAPVLAALTGNESFEQILEKFKPHGLADTTLKELITLLDDHLFLSNSKFFARDKELKENFKEATVRKAFLAGLSYPADRDELTKLVDSYLEKAPPSKDVKNPILLVAPHIDYRRGGEGYGVAYSDLKACEPDLIILIGTNHQYTTTLFQLTPKTFESPLGELPSDIEFITKLAARYGIDRSFQDEFLHRREHSLELQLPFLHRVIKKGKIVPILVGGFHHMVRSQKIPSETPEYDEFVSALGELLREERNAGKNILVVAGVDMAHVGPHFGDEKPLTVEFMQEVELRDAQYLECITKNDKKAMFSHIAEDQDSRRICGFPTMYTILDLFDRERISYKAETLDYRQAVDYHAGVAVTFASVSCCLK